MLLRMYGMEITGIIINFIVQGLLQNFHECEMHIWANASLLLKQMVFTPRKPIIIMFTIIIMFIIAIFRSPCD